eukprot:6213534-Pleurochrysis_carterae.AAC.3
MLHLHYHAHPHYPQSVPRHLQQQIAPTPPSHQQSYLPPFNPSTSCCGANLGQPASMHYGFQQNTLPPTPDSERALVKHMRMLRAQQVENGIPDLSGQVAGLQFELEAKRKDRKRPAGSF